MDSVGLGIWSMMIPAALFVFFAFLELLAPRRKLVLGRRRWLTHAVFFVGNLAVGRSLIGLVSVAGAAIWATKSGLGLFHLTPWPIWLEVGLAFILLDFAVWLQHVMMHKFPILWRMHKVHHSDRDLDASSALRFHPIEIIFSVIYKSVWVAILGVPLLFALTFELWLNANAIFNHSNIALPRWLDNLLRPVLVTPNYHFVHHSARINEQHRNYGFAISLWDRLSGVYQPESVDTQDLQRVGLPDAQDARPGSIIWSMLLPFH
jgi:sterol desaturase/sphingolipid hydroxylase (fatty acid hydroxylase superfamily)